ncbi:MAG TPA: insulinase family protein [Cyclobacteriaceae bacterium]|nr:insulinase family protein [Cyclobacteriaceae bacterium]
MKRPIFILFLSILSIGILPAQEVKTDKIPLDLGVKKGKLPNGMTYYIRKNTEPKNRAELYLVNKIGSLQEEDNQQGLAHFSEHMAFNGTRDFPKNSLVNFLQTSGVRFGADLNAYTSFDQTVYQLPIPTDDLALFGKGFDILLNWAGHVSFDGTEIDNERGVILEEERLRGKNMQERITKQIYPVLMANSRFADRLPIGKTDILKNFQHQLIKDFYRDWYRPDLQAVIAVGDFDVTAVEKMIIEKFSTLKNPASERKLLDYKVPDNKATLVKIVTDPEYPNNSVSVFYKHPEEIVTTETEYRNSLVRSMINSMIGDRLGEILQKGNAPFLNASIDYDGFIGHQDAFSLSIESKDVDGLEKAVRAVVTEAIRMTFYGFTGSELDRAKQNMISGITRSYNERNKISSSFYVNEYQKNFLTGEASPGIETEFRYYNEILPKVTLDEINKTAATFMTKENRIVLLEANDRDKAKLPTDAKLLSWLEVDPKTVTAYKEDVVNDKLFTTLPKAGAILSEKKIASLGATELTLSNGIKVVLKPTDFKDDQILFGGISKGGLSLAEDKKFRSAQYAPFIVDASGIANFNGTQLNKMLTGKVFSSTPYINFYEEGINGSSTPADIETALQLTHLYFTAPRRDTAILSTIKEQLEVSVKNRYTNPVAAYQDTSAIIMNNRNFRSRPLTEKELQAVNLDDAMAFYKDRFSDASDFTFFFVGAFDTEKIKPLITTYLASLPATNRKESYKDLGLKPVDGKVSRTVYRGLEDKAAVSLTYHGPYHYSEQTNMELDALREILLNKLTERLREKESGVYSPGVNVREDKIPTPQYRIGISFNCSTENVEKLIASVRDEIQIMKTKGVTDEDLAKFKAEEKRQLELRLRENNFWMSNLKQVYREEKIQNFVETYPGLLDKLSTENVKQAAVKYFNDDQFIRIVLLPESAKK